MIIEKRKIAIYNSYCLHYEILANECYKKLRQLGSPLHTDYFPYIIAALIVFDMDRQMGSGLKQKYDQGSNGFAARLQKKITEQEDNIAVLSSLTLSNVDMNKHYKFISSLYNSFSCANGLCESEKSFHVGATKILHFMLPELFPLIDSNVARILKNDFFIEYSNTTTPGYSSERYIESMQKIQEYINKYGVEAFRVLEIGTPLTRIFDKLAFVEGSGLDK